MSRWVVHVKKSPFDVYIGRKTKDFPKSKWGNPFVIGVDGNREEVIEKYKKYILGSKHLLSCLPELRNKVLGCWCSPYKCHGDVLIELLIERNIMSVDDLIKNLEEIKQTSKIIKGDSLVCFGDKSQSVDYFIVNPDGKLVIKEEWY